MDRRFHRLGADPDHVATEERCREADNEAAEAPEPHNPAGAGISLGHRCAKNRAMADFVLPHLFESGHHVGIIAPGVPELGGIDPDRTGLARVVDADDSGDGCAFAVGQSRHARSGKGLTAQ